MAQHSRRIFFDRLSGRVSAVAIGSTLGEISSRRASIAGQSPQLDGELSVYHQGNQRGGLTFPRLDGGAIYDGNGFSTATSGDAEAGQVWPYRPAEEQLALLIESPGASALDMPDKRCVSPWGDILLCEDGDHLPQRWQALTPPGVMSPFGENDMRLQGIYGDADDYRGGNWAAVRHLPGTASGCL